MVSWKKMVSRLPGDICFKLLPFVDLGIENFNEDTCNRKLF